MTDAADFRRIALALPGVAEYPHFDRRAFKARVTFATLAPDELTANLKFAPDEQALKCAVAPDAFAALDNAWGRRGWTRATLAALSEPELARRARDGLAPRRGEDEARSAASRSRAPSADCAPASVSLASHSLFAAASSRAAADGSAILRLTKYSPVVLATSGEEAR